MDALEIALQMESDAVKFYTEASHKMMNPAGKKMFLAIAEDEKTHIEIISQIIKGLRMTPRDVTPLKNVKTIFESMKNEMMKKIAASSDDMESFKVAMKMEQEGVDFYKKTLSKTTKEKEKTLLARLIKEEQQHYSMFSNTYNYLEKTGQWFLWEESPIRAMIEGG